MLNLIDINDLKIVITTDEGGVSYIQTNIDQPLKIAVIDHRVDDESDADEVLELLNGVEVLGHIEESFTDIEEVNLVFDSFERLCSQTEPFSLEELRKELDALPKNETASKVNWVSEFSIASVDMISKFYNPTNQP